MNGETDLTSLLRGMRPSLHDQPFVFCSLSQEIYNKLQFESLASFHEVEGITVIITAAQARQAGLKYETLWAWITLTVHSSLSAVGFLAAITHHLAQAGISVNPISAYYHDHLFVPWEKRQMALDILQEVSR